MLCSLTKRLIVWSPSGKPCGLNDTAAVCSTYIRNLKDFLLLLIYRQNGQNAHNKIRVAFMYGKSTLYEHFKPPLSDGIWKCFSKLLNLYPSTGMVAACSIIMMYYVYWNIIISLTARSSWLKLTATLLFGQARFQQTQRLAFMAQALGNHLKTSI